jgi:hypothetical protein
LIPGAARLVRDPFLTRIVYFHFLAENT